ncbi:MAG TPA: hypothetical protein VFR90_06135 [Methylibium sp.]|uniref:hypothetical protein n=1 Tax=Methylibium sp. TaxID=2067992 RepID=UPI002DBE52F1|nr:hypothetical protein [Methylibium sp.]HEU4458684.1 hypothetical protein [Methylibium sp.]
MPSPAAFFPVRSFRSSRAAKTAGALAALALLGACASPQVDTQWTDPQFAGQSLRGARLYVVCEAPDEALARQCQDRLAAEAAALGATAVPAETRPQPVPGRAGTADVYLPAARDAQARAVLLASVGPAARTVQPGPSVGIGLGGFGGGRVGVGGGVGFSLPIGGSRVNTSYGANTLLTDVASGRLMWTANTSAPSGDAAEQVGELVKAAMGGAQKAGFF